ncbi:pSer/pThr/pTyr-binding forkhead associated (FHA) protein [Marmoricola sp. OAE513]|uniref:FHA domain-containing protein n=1 Tax=Marmoricola sp. OAE513 TaxID=2817894 RepID=UPI001AEB2113
MQTCSQCGSQNVDGSRFCSHCGHALETSDVPAETTATITFGSTQARPVDPEDGSGLNEADAAAADALPPGNALLIVQRGPGAGSRYLLDTDLVSAGRHPESDIFLDDITVSRRHVELRREGGTFRVSDVGSLNGTYVNRDRIDDALLQNGDEVRIGKFRLVFFASAATGD